MHTYLIRRLKGLVNEVDHLIHEFGESQIVPNTANESL